MFWVARSQWSREDHDHRNPGRSAGADLGRGRGAGQDVAVASPRVARVAGHITAGDTALGEADGQGNTAVVLQFLPASDLGGRRAGGAFAAGKSGYLGRQIVRR